MNQPSLSPISISYVAALRGVTPRTTGDSFTYGVVDCRDAEALIGLAASNPDGQFYGFVSDPVACVNGWEQANLRKVSNIHFTAARPTDVLARFGQDNAFLPPLDYLVFDTSAAGCSAADRTAVQDLAVKALKEDGLFIFAYQSNPDVTATLRFLVREAAPEMNADQANVFLDELKKLGKLYFANHKDYAQALDAAIKSKIPDAFFDQFDAGESRSATFDNILAMRPRGFVYAGDCDLSRNYVELAIPKDAQEIVVKCRNNLLYETIKDFTLNRSVRHDIWCRQDAAMSENPVALFGGFSYGITTARTDIPATYAAEGKSIALDTPLFKAVIDLLVMMPASIGDILSYPSCQDFPTNAVVESVQVLVACGIARPMRGTSPVQTAMVSSIAQPRLVGGFNQYLNQTQVQGEMLSVASPILGDVMKVSPQEALVIQALNRAGLANSPQALLLELTRLGKNADIARKVMNATEATPEIAQQMVEDTVTQSIVKWYAYGILEAA